GDNGILDPTMTPEMVDKMRWLISFADVITPNFTEVALLLNEPCRAEVDATTLQNWLRRLADMGPGTVVATSVPLTADCAAQGFPHRMAVVAFERDADRFWKVDCPILPAHYPGTGDTFASVLTGSLLHGDSLSLALDRAVQFVTLGIRATFGQGVPTREGILLERILDTLRVPVTVSSCELMAVSA
ncbi:MAG: bifunctional hydroxymethylpyrimidine kinase/phosphomethylpyrimidine kinase, partial [Bilophila sp.]